MGLNIKMKLPKAIDIFKVIPLWEKSCINITGERSFPVVGVQDEFHRIKGEFLSFDEANKSKAAETLKQSNKFILFDFDNMGRGIILKIVDDVLIFEVLDPAPLSEIGGVFNLVKLIYKQIPNSQIKYGNDLVTYEQFADKCFYDAASRSAKLLMNPEFDVFTICAVMNPIAITKQLVEGFDDHKTEENQEDRKIFIFKNYEKFLRELQGKDIFYATFFTARKKDESADLVALIIIPEDCYTAIPTNPTKELVFKDQKIDLSTVTEFYAVLPYNGERKYVKYSGFLKYVDAESKEHYDATHVIIKLSNEDINNIANEE